LIFTRVSEFALLVVFAPDESYTRAIGVVYGGPRISAAPDPLNREFSIYSRRKPIGGDLTGHAC